MGRPTLMRAMDRLKRDGFLRSDSTRGTFVSSTPPHLHRFGVVFCSAPTRRGLGGWNRFWAAISDEAQVEHHQSHREVVCYYGVCDGTSDSLQTLQADLAHDRLAGLIIVGSFQLMQMASVIEAPVRKVAIFDGVDAGHIPHVYVDHGSFMTKATEYLLGRNRTRIAVIRNETDGFASLLDRALAAGANSRPFWSLSASGLHPASAVNIVRVLFDRPQAERPDALVITDDNLVEHVLSALISAGISVPDDLEVVAHCNWPAPVGSVLPVKRLGYDVGELMSVCVRLLERSASPDPGTKLLIPARFEEEIGRAKLSDR